MMYKRHLPHKITPEARVVWLKCYEQVLHKTDLPEDVLQSFWKYLNDLFFLDDKFLNCNRLNYEFFFSGF